MDGMLDPQPADPCLKQPGNAGGALLRFDCVTGQKVCTQSDASVLNAKERFNDICPTNYEASVGLLMRSLQRLMKTEVEQSTATSHSAASSQGTMPIRLESTTCGSDMF